MLDRLLPSPASFTYRGHRVALWLAAFLVLFRAAIGVRAVFDGHYVAAIADGIPIDSYAPAAARTVLALVANLGLSQLAMAAVGLLIVFRYRAALPGYLLLLVIEFLARKGIAYMLPIQRVGGEGGGILNWILFALLLTALALSLRVRPRTGQGP